MIAFRLTGPRFDFAFFDVMAIGALSATNTGSAAPSLLRTSITYSLVTTIEKPTYEHSAGGITRSSPPVKERLPGTEPGAGMHSGSAGWRLTPA